MLHTSTRSNVFSGKVNNVWNTMNTLVCEVLQNFEKPEWTFDCRGVFCHETGLLWKVVVQLSSIMKEQVTNYSEPLFKSTPGDYLIP